MKSNLLKRGDIWMVRFGPIQGREQDGARPAVVVSSDLLDPDILELAIVIPGTSTARMVRGQLVPNHLQVSPDARNGLMNVTYFMTEQIHGVSTSRFLRSLGKLAANDLAALSSILSLMLDLGPD